MCTGGKLTVMVTTCVVVDDHASFRRMARRFMVAAGCVVVGEAASVSSAVEVVVDQQPDVVLLDVMLPDGTAADVVAQIDHADVRPRLLLTSSHASTDIPISLDGLAFIAKSDLTVESLRAWLDET